MKSHYEGKLFTLDWDDINLDACLVRCQTILDNYANVQKLLYRQSSSKSGYHIRGFLYSSTNIPHLRFILLDDPRRILNDIYNRPNNIHGILYDRKTISGKVEYAGQWKDFKPQKIIDGEETKMIDDKCSKKDNLGKCRKCIDSHSSHRICNNV